MIPATECVFLLSPAHSGGKRAFMLTRPAATFQLARQVQIGSATLGDVFTFCSGLYFRGKLKYARYFENPPPGVNGVHIITAGYGLVSPEQFVGTRELAEFSKVPVDPRELRFTMPLRETAAALAAAGSFRVVLLGSVATGKYIDTLLPIFGERLLFPTEFAGRGDMSRGALMLRAVASQCELSYERVLKASPALSETGRLRKGTRPARFRGGPDAAR